MLWHDTSTISDHSYLLMVVKCVHDPAIFYINEAFRQKYNKNINIQVEIEKPFTYIIAQCPPTDDQIKYINTRLEDLNEMKTSTLTKKGNINDVVRFLHGDGSASSFVIGHQEGENYFYWDCCIPAEYCHDISHTFYTPSVNINSRMNALTATTRSLNMLHNRKLKIYENLSKVDIVDDLHQRNISFYQNQTKEFLHKLLKKEVKGIQHVLALLVPNINNVDILNNYEVLPNEPMHDIAGHWKNLLAEIPYHLPKTEKSLFQCISMVGLNKDTKRAVDYRKTAINLSIHLIDKINNDIYQILLTGCNMQEILYAFEQERNMKLILR